MRKTVEILDAGALDALFSTARDNPATPSDALLDRLCQTALAEQPRPAWPAARQAIRQAAPQPRALALLMEAIGGWPALAGLATAGVAGLWIGFNPPQTLTSWIGPGDLTALAPYDLSLLDEEG